MTTKKFSLLDVARNAKDGKYTAAIRERYGMEIKATYIGEDICKKYPTEYMYYSSVRYFVGDICFYLRHFPSNCSYMFIHGMGNSISEEIFRIVLDISNEIAENGTYTHIIFTLNQYQVSKVKKVLDDNPNIKELQRNKNLHSSNTVYIFSYATRYGQDIIKEVENF